MMVMADGQLSFGATVSRVWEKELSLDHVRRAVADIIIAVVDVAFVVLLFECVCCLLLLLLSFAVAFANWPRIEIWECIICTVLYLKTRINLLRPKTERYPKQDIMSIVTSELLSLLLHTVNTKHSYYKYIINVQSDENRST